VGSPLGNSARTSLRGYWRLLMVQSGYRSPDSPYRVNANTDEEYNTAGRDGTNAWTIKMPSCSERPGRHLFPSNFFVKIGLWQTEVSMTRVRRFGFAAGVLTLLLTYPLASQTAPSPVSPRGTTSTRPVRQSPCWQQAGISQSAIQQHRQIEESTRSQVESVCSDSSLTPQQKQEKIRQLHQQAQRQAGGLITPQQENALKSCRASRSEAPHMGGMHGGAGGPCGEMTSGNKP
jgi:hypothetical protein